MADATLDFYWIVTTPEEDRLVRPDGSQHSYPSRWLLIYCARSRFRIQDTEDPDEFEVLVPASQRLFDDPGAIHRWIRRERRPPRST